MYTECIIKFVDSGEEMYAVIKEDNKFDEKYDELIFFYGLSKEALEEAAKDGVALEGEWVVQEVLSSIDSFDDEFYMSE